MTRHRRSIGDHVIHAAAIAARCSPEAMRRRDLSERVVRVRDCAMAALARAGWSRSGIGRLFDGRDHSTVRTAIARAEARWAARGRESPGRRDMRSNIHDVSVLFESETPAAIGVRAQEGAALVWLPFSEIEVSGARLRGAVVEVTAEDWLLKREGLI